MILAGRKINDKMGEYICSKIRIELGKKNIIEKKSKCLI